MEIQGELSYFSALNTLEIPITVKTIILMPGSALTYIEIPVSVNTKVPGSFNLYGSAIVKIHATVKNSHGILLVVVLV